MQSLTANRSMNGDFSLMAWVVVFVLTGIASPMLVMQTTFKYHPPPGTLWMLYPLYLGNLLAGAFGPSVPRHCWLDGSRLFGFDCGGQILSNLGLVVIGPPLYAIFYKSVTVFTGLFSLAVLPPKSHPSWYQWCAMLVITSGLLMQGVDALYTLTRNQLYGAMFVVGGCLFFAGGAVATELYLGGGRVSALAPLQAAWVFGVQGTTLCVLWAMFTVRDLSYGVGFWLLFGGLVLTNAGHQAAWFFLVGRIGACATAVLKAFQSACLFITAALAFCSVDKLECLTREKLISFFVVSAGVMLYAYPSRSYCSSSKSLEAASLVSGDAISCAAPYEAARADSRKD